MRLILVRHAQTEGNVKRVLEGPEGKLSTLGARQAAAVAKRLKDEDPDAIYSSPYLRTRETAQAIAKYHKN
jgi:broad specificity phosphatase PhoE